jgi:hypothetical protein
MTHPMLPAPPVDAIVSGTVEVAVTTVMASLTIAALVFALVYWWRTGRPTVLMLFLAGGAMMLLEPFVDVVGGCWHPQDLARAFTLWQRPMPIWLCLTYFVYFGIGGGLSWIVFRRSPTPRALWLIFVSGIVGDVVLETVLLHWNTYVYYGNQPLVLLKFPMWWAAVNPLVDVVVVVALVRYQQALRGPRTLLIIPMAVGISTAVNAVVGLPSWTAINSDLGGITRDLLGVGTYAIAVVVMVLITRTRAETGGAAGLVADDQPVRGFSGVTP